MAKETLFSASDFTEKKYREAKQYCNAYERYWRSKHPDQHKKNSRKLLTKIRKPKNKKAKTDNASS